MEQSIVTGIDGEGKPLSKEKLLSMITNRMAQGNMDSGNKLRLLLIASISLDLSEKERKTIAANLPEQDRVALYRLTWLGVNLNESSVAKGKSSKKLSGVSLAAKNKLKNISTDLLRHTSVLETMAADVVSGQINSTQYGNLYIPSTYDGGVKGKVKTGGLASQIASLRKGGKQTNWSENVDEKVQPKYVFFFIGGMAYSEMRILSELEKSNPNITVMMGSTALIRPNDYCEGIKNMISTMDYDELKAKGK